MTRRRSLLAAFLVLGLALAAATLFFGFRQQFAGSWLTFGTHPEVLEQLDAGLEDLKTLGRLDSERRSEYHQRFQRAQRLRQRLEILARSREDLVRRYQQILAALLAAAAVVVGAAGVMRYRQREARLALLRGALEDLAAGRTDRPTPAVGGGTLGRIAGMIDNTSRVMARDRRRLAALDNLSAWQEAARRHAHEMRTPLTGATLELRRLASMLKPAAQLHRDDALQAARSAEQELQRLGRFTQAFTSFARLPEPQRVEQDLGVLLEEFVTTFGDAWPGLELSWRPVVEGETPAPRAAVDRDMLRQVLVNLCDNSARAVKDSGRSMGRVRCTVGVVGAVGGGGRRVEILVEDDGPGVSPDLAPRLFEPYVSSRGVGDGMGLGLAICRKILLDHGGDLELASPGAGAASPSVDRPDSVDCLKRSLDGAAFRLHFPLIAPASLQAPPRGAS